MRLAYISYEFPPDTGKGGIGTYVQQMAAAMSSFDWDIHVFCGSSHTGTYFQNGYTVHRIECKDWNDFRDKIVEPFSKEHSRIPFSLIESPEINGNAWSIKKKFPELIMVVRVHAPNYLVESLKKKYIPFLAKLRFVAGSVKRLKFDAGYWRSYQKETDPDYQFTRLADFINAPSAAMKNWIVENWKISPQQVEVIPNIFSPSRELLDIPVNKNPDFKTVVFFGRLNVLKGVVNMTIAMKRILKEYPGWKFKVIGDDGPGPTVVTGMKAWMTKELAEVIDRVTYQDGIRHSDLPGAIAKCEIIILPSLFESFSYACAEAMAAGKALVGSRNGGMADLLENGVTGVLIDPTSSAEIYEATKKYIDNDSLRYQYAIKARESVLQKCNAKETASVFRAYYEKLIVTLN